MTHPKHLEFLQAIITRLAGNSFQIKAWNVALATAAVGYAATKDSHPTAAVLAAVPSFAFWCLDAYYLGLERIYRDHYNSAVIGAVPPFDLKAPELGLSDWLGMIWRPAVAGLHLPMVAVILLVSLTNFAR
jgi:hypothetical protein